MTNDVDVGYARPPKEHRWQKGQSGNPKGRPKSQSEYLQDAADILSQPVTAKQADGTTVFLDSLEAGYLALCKKALKGHKPSLLNAIEFLLDVGFAAEESRCNEAALRARAKELIEKLGLPCPRHLED